MCAHPQERGTASGRMPREPAEPGSAGKAALVRVTSAPGGTCPRQVSGPDEAARALPKYSPVYSQHGGGTSGVASAWGRHGPRDAGWGHSWVGAWGPWEGPDLVFPLGHPRNSLGLLQLSQGDLCPCL